ncbi:hypothetical protein RUM44_012763 [Polyplax serrata]|uniref:Uncharacterized protein n=1 Tax=Polyplax serrata TaxID=468196 RepID=A0ABR1BG94_POLSC
MESTLGKKYIIHTGAEMKDGNGPLQMPSSGKIKSMDPENLKKKVQGKWMRQKGTGETKAKAPAVASAAAYHTHNMFPPISSKATL